MQDPADYAQAENHQDEQGEKKHSTLDTSVISNLLSDRRATWSGLLFAIEPLTKKATTMMTERDGNPTIVNWITLVDNGSRRSIFSNPDLVEKIRTTSKRLSHWQ